MAKMENWRTIGGGKLEEQKVPVAVQQLPTAIHGKLDLTEHPRNDIYRHNNLKRNWNTNDI
jgi:hypothetical protein